MGVKDTPLSLKVSCNAGIWSPSFMRRLNRSMGIFVFFYLQEITFWLFIRGFMAMTNRIVVNAGIVPYHKSV